MQGGYVQNRRISENMKEGCTTEARTSVVIYMDYNMKFEPVRHRESTAQFYGKKGMSWKGFAVF